MRLPVQLLSHDSFRVVIDGHDIWFNPQDYRSSYGLPRGKVKATWCFLTNLETAYVPILLDWAKGYKDVHFITGPMAYNELSEAGVPAEKLILADDQGWAISRQISFKAIGTLRDAPSYLLTTSIGNLLFASQVFAQTDGAVLMQKVDDVDTVFCQVANRQMPRPHRIQKHSLRGRLMGWLSNASMKA